MKKQVILGLALMMASFSFAQKKELKTAEKAIKSNNFSEAKAVLKQAESMLSGMDEKLKAKFYYLNGKALYANGTGTNDDVNLALESLKKVDGAYETEILELKQQMVNGFVTKANNAYEKKDFATSSTYFENTYRISEKDTVFLYYAASTAVNVQEYDRALTLYDELKGLGYTGIETQYFAVNNETGDEDSFNDKMLRDLSVRSKSHSEPSEKISESKKAEIIKNIALIYVASGDNEKAIAALKEARIENPNDVNLLLSEANAYYKMGDSEKYKELIKEALELDPNNADLVFNLGVFAAEEKDYETAGSYYNKAIELNPDYTNAYMNMAAMILDQEEGIIDEMNALGTSAADNKKYDDLRAKREGLYSTAVPYLVTVLEKDSKNLSAARTLMNIYSALGEDDKFKELKALVDTLGN